MRNEQLEINIEPRNPGKGLARKLRKEKKVPAVIYGSKVGNASVYVEENVITKYHTRAFENALFKLKTSDRKLADTVVLMKEVNVHPVTRRPLHVDLFALDLTKTIRLFVETRLEGKPAGLAEGGLLNHVNHKIEVECLPNAIPEFIAIDVSHLGVGDAVHVSDLKMPEGVKAISGGDLTIAVVNQAEEELAAVPAAAAAAPGTEATAGAPATAAAPAADAKAAAKPAPAKK